MLKQTFFLIFVLLSGSLTTGCATQADIDRVDAQIGHLTTEMRTVNQVLKSIRRDLDLQIKYRGSRWKGSSRLPPNSSDTWVLIDTRALSLSVRKGNKVLKRFDNIAIGTKGSGYKKQRGDSKTPVGEFRIGWTNPKSRFHYFFGLDYPSLDYARRGLRAGKIDNKTFKRIEHALASGTTPPQRTPLGGMIGIHGIGGADPYIHKRMNWTQGCIAMTDQQIDQLKRWVGKGTRVVIR